MIIAVAALLLAPALLLAQVVPRGARSAGTSAAITTADLRARVSIIADDTTLGRETGSAGDDAAARYVAAEFRRLGLAPGGEHGTFFQQVPLVRHVYDPQSAIRVDGGPPIASADFAVLHPALNLPAGTARPFEGAQAVYGGIDGDTTYQIGAAEANGRVVVLAAPIGADGVRHARSRADEIHPRLLGAAAIAFVTLDITPAEYLESWRQPALILRGDPVWARPMPSYLVISPQMAHALLGVAVDGARLGQLGRTVRGSVGFVEQPLERPTRNVVAILRGRSPGMRGEYVSISAHHDHIGSTHTPVEHDSVHAFMRAYERFRQASPERRVSGEQERSIRVNVDSLRRRARPRADSIFNGADDDASGIAAQLEIAESLVHGARRPARSILFIAHTAEERGLLGSRWFADHPTIELDSLVAELDMDMVGRGSASDLDGGGSDYLELIGSRRRSTELGDLIDRVNGWPAHRFRINYAYDAPGHPEQDWCRADHYSYARHGIPVAAFSTSYHGDYHQVTDEAQYLDYPHMARIAAFVRDVALTIAELDRRPLLDKPRPDPDAPCRQ